MSNLGISLYVLLQTLDYILCFFMWDSWRKNWHWSKLFILFSFLSFCANFYFQCAPYSSVMSPL